MLDSARYGVLYSTLKKYISSLLEHAAFYDKPETRESIADVVKDEFDLFLFLASKVNLEDEAKAILVKFREVFLVDSGEGSSKQDYSDKSFEELHDDISYLRVCVKNICGLDLDNLNIQALKKEENAPIKNYKSSNYQNIPNSLAAFRHALNEDISFDPSVSKELGDFLLRSHAYERLNKDINDGSVYIYTSKPKINAIVKYVLIGLSVLGVFISMALLVLSFFHSDSNSRGLKYGWTILYGIGTFYFAKSIFSLCKNMKNDNFKYSFGRREFVSSNVFVLLTIPLMIFDGVEIGFVSQSYPKPMHVCTLIFLIISVSFTTIVVLSYFFLQPKKNTQLVESILEQHMSDLSKGTSF